MASPSWSALLDFLDQPARDRGRGLSLRSEDDDRFQFEIYWSASLSVIALLLILFAESLGKRFAVRIEEFLAALLPRRFEFRRCDVPIRAAFSDNCAQVLAEFFQRGPPEEPVAVVDLINDKAGLEDNRVGDHGIVYGISIFGDVEIFLDGSPRVGEERPVSTNAAAIFICLSDVVGANRDQSAIANLKLTMELNKPFSLAAVLGAEPPASQDENHWILPLQFGELPAFRGVVGKLVIGEYGS